MEFIRYSIRGTECLSRANPRRIDKLGIETATVDLRLSVEYLAHLSSGSNILGDSARGLPPGSTRENIRKKRDGPPGCPLETCGDTFGPIEISRLSVFARRRGFGPPKCLLRAPHRLFHIARRAFSDFGPAFIPRVVALNFRSTGVVTRVAPPDPFVVFES